jgi:hypothetical protein
MYALMQLIETCVKNCNLPFHSMIGSREVLSDIVMLTDGKKVGPQQNHFYILPSAARSNKALERLKSCMLAPCSQGWDVKEQALGLIQQWGLAFQARQDILPYFYETYMKLRLKVRGHSQARICKPYQLSKNTDETFR